MRPQLITVLAGFTHLPAAALGADAEQVLARRAEWLPGRVDLDCTTTSPPPAAQQDTSVVSLPTYLACLERSWAAVERCLHQCKCIDETPGMPTTTTSTAGDQLQPEDMSTVGAAASKLVAGMVHQLKTHIPVVSTGFMYGTTGHENDDDFTSYDDADDYY